MSKNLGTQSPYDAFTGPNLGYVMEMYELFKSSPELVDDELAEMFNRFGAPIEDSGEQVTIEGSVQSTNIGKVIAAFKLQEAIRTYGHLAADVYPLGDRPKDLTRIELSYYGLSEKDLEDMPASLFLTHVPAHIENGLEAINYMKSLYTGKISYEFAHVIDEEERQWIQSKIENGEVSTQLSADDKKALLEKLTKIEGFEKYIHRTFVGAKRFSIEGLDTLVVLLDELVRRSEEDKVKKMLIGMAHRGRLNVLAHILKNPYEMFFAHFAGVSDQPFLPTDGSLETTRGWFGDVVYHYGSLYNSPSGMQRFLAYNPSHLEVVNAVVTGQTRAAQEAESKAGNAVQDTNSAYAILVHGDAAFPGQGVVPETFNYSRVRGFKTGGSIHVIANNMIGFTTEHYDSRSTHYSSDPAKGFEVPIIHVNADCPESVIAVASFAFEYRQKFGKDIVIDLLGYRRYGHNEMDEPLVTNPTMYHKVHQHPTVREMYGNVLTTENVVTAEEVEKLDEDTFKLMQQAHDVVREHPSAKEKEDKEIVIPDEVLAGYPAELETGVAEDKLRTMNEELLNFPEEFNVFGRLVRILKRREEPFKGNGKIDWAHAETLAFGSILQDGNPIRLTGQDVQRGTFAHRHLVLHDEKTGEEYLPLHHISGANASFDAFNSPLTESAIVGYEYGYNLENQKALSIWEAQYGDFANMAQVMFDQFISASRSKWGQQSGLVMLLPHAHEGQGPEHTSARLERFLQMSAENNWTVANLSSAANYFHILRRQAKMLGEPSMRPLVIVSPKSLLRHPLVGADVEDLTEGSFQTVLEQPGTGTKKTKVERILFASGKMAIDLAEQVKDGEGFDDIHIVRVEQLYPFPSEKIQEIVSRYSKVKELVWVQEEPKNMGSWSFAYPYIQEIAGNKKVSYVGRPDRSSPSEGDGASHSIEQKRIINEALNR
ncbi:2-oxoglutarate dehydrogenase E1 component [Sporosarcina ureilytica]|uniref:2-oxoglutarate dehydrogenase E1 component n=1 Tax=Sporosarcina ureilytica TaxID=298596 RepID=A0A1D8JG64_9BACL|nr:2-oxoglutarate dehydrogenase E1 component [Sporosarcina ureilytica]AOV07698.1 2-oxoglutarate dehydrogenase E1 component [Sporosarcina ureilytica]